jgi:glycosyltransferase involved in cell wall biosynthesis
MAMHLDVIVPTYNRQNLLRLTLESLFAAEVPSGLNVAVTVVDNNSKDQTRLVVQAFRKRFGERIQYRFEPQQGRSHALNAGIASTAGDLVGMIDDDEEIDPGWYRAAFETFNLKGVDFIGGPYEPRWGLPPPVCLAQEYSGAVGWVDGGKNEVPFDSSYPGILMGGNVVIRRSVLERVGDYTTWLGRTDKGLLSGEDEDFYFRLLASGAKGLYLPNLIIYHHVPPERLTKSYFRRWCFWRAVSLGLLDRTRKLPCQYLLGIPRWHYLKAAEGLASVMSGLFVKSGDPARAFADELAVWTCIGLFYGRHFHRSSTSASIGG